MRFINSIILAGVFFAFFAEAGQEQQNPGEAQSAAKKQSAPVTKMMEGMLVSVDQTKQTFIVKLRGTEYTFMATGNTEITVCGSKKSFADLSAGDGVRVTYNKDDKGNRIAVSISQNSARQKAATVTTKPASEAKAKVEEKKPAETKPAAETQSSAAMPAPAEQTVKPLPAPQQAAPQQQSAQTVQPQQPVPGAKPAEPEKK